MRKQNNVGILEMFLRIWEDVMFGIQLNQGEAARGSVRHWSEFREYLLRYRQGQPFDKKRFLPSEEDTSTPRDVAPMIASWVSCSKRIYRVSKEMQAIFSRIKMGNMRVSDLVPPFPAFGVQLEDPVESRYGKKLDFILVSNYPELVFDLPEEKKGAVVSISSFPSAIMQYQPLDHNEKMTVIRSWGEQDRKPWVAKMQKRLHMALSNQVHVLNRFPVSGSFFGLNRDTLIEDYLAELSKNLLNEADVLQVRIVFNLILYLQSLPSGAEKVEGAKWKTESAHENIPVNRAERLARIITSGNQVCDVIGRHIINSMIRDERSETERSSGYEVDPHWRRAHKRRLPGLGQDPTAEKTVKVRHTLVREDRVPEVGVVKGSVSEVIG